MDSSKFTGLNGKQNEVRGNPIEARPKRIASGIIHADEILETLDKLVEMEIKMIFISDERYGELIGYGLSHFPNSGLELIEHSIFKGGIEYKGVSIFPINVTKGLTP